VDIVRIYSDADGESHFEDVQVDLAAFSASGLQTASSELWPDRHARLGRRSGRTRIRPPTPGSSRSPSSFGRRPDTAASAESRPDRGHAARRSG
jgi:hypothetical protein